MARGFAECQFRWSLAGAAGRGGIDTFEAPDAGPLRQLGRPDFLEGVFDAFQGQVATAVGRLAR